MALFDTQGGKVQDLMDIHEDQKVFIASDLER